MAPTADRLSLVCRRAVASARARWRTIRPIPPKIATLPHERTLVSEQPVRLLGLVTAWMEADIIGSSVANAFAQGCDAVYLIDNDSPDATAEVAQQAGAEVYCRFATSHYDEPLKYALMRHLMKSVASKHDGDTWWLLFDADEFPRARSGTIREMLTRIDPLVRVVGATYLNHYPTSEVDPEATDPVAEQPMAELFAPPTFCAQRHRKHPLLRYGADRPPVEPDLGFHSVISASRQVPESNADILMHHLPLRRESDSRARLDALFGAGQHSNRALADSQPITAHMRARYDTLDAIYQGRWSDVMTMGDRGPVRGVALTTWQDLVD